MALSKIDAANFLTGTIPSGNIATSSLAAAATGKVLQVITATDTGNRSTTSTSFVTGSNTLSVDITPASTSNKIFVQVNGLHYAGTNGKSVHSTIYRDSTELSGQTYGFASFYIPSNVMAGNGLSMSVLDSPNTTSQVTYQVYFKAQSGTSAYLGYNNCKMTITAFEIAG